MRPTFSSKLATSFVASEDGAAYVMTIHEEGKVRYKMKMGRGAAGMEPGPPCEHTVDSCRRSLASSSRSSALSSLSCRMF